MDPNKPNLVKVYELSLYEECCCKKKMQITKSPPPTYLEEYVKQTREEVEGFIKPILGNYPQQAWNSVQSSVSFVNDSIVLVRDEKNQAARAAFITSAGFLGYIIGRRGIFKRLTFGLIGAGAAAATCNPTQAKDLSEVTLDLAKAKFSELYSEYGNKGLSSIGFNLDYFTKKSPDSK